MSRLRHVDLALFSEAISLLYSASDLPSLSTRATACLHLLFDCEVASFDLFDVSALQWSTVVVSPMVANWDDAVAVLQSHAHEHPIVTYAARNNDPHAIRTSDLLSLREYRRSGLYQEFFRVHLMGVNRQLGFVAKPSPTLTVGASVNRCGLDFSEEERSLLEHLRPHLLRAYVLSQRVHRDPCRPGSDQELAADLAGGAMCKIEASGKIIWMTADVAPLLARYFPKSAADGRLPSELLAALRPVFTPRPRRFERFKRANRSLEFLGASGTLRIRCAADPTERRWQLLLAEERQGQLSEAFVRRYGLTARESEVLYWISNGKTNDEIAIILAISSRTVEKYVQYGFDKLGVYNRASATSVVLTANAWASS